MERKFKVGDRVRILVAADILAIEKPITSLIGEITYVDDSTTIPYRVWRDR